MKPPEKVYVCAFYCGRRLQKNNILNIKDSKNRKATGLWKKADYYDAPKHSEAEDRVKQLGFHKLNRSRTKIRMFTAINLQNVK